MTGGARWRERATEINDRRLMPDEKYTRCPDCATVFRVTPEQLALARARCRCGQCKTVFDGIAQQVAVAPLPPPGCRDVGRRPHDRPADRRVVGASALQPRPPAAAVTLRARRAADRGSRKRRRRPLRVAEPVVAPRAYCAYAVRHRRAGPSDSRPGDLPLPRRDRHVLAGRPPRSSAFAPSRVARSGRCATRR